MVKIEGKTLSIVFISNFPAFCVSFVPEQGTVGCSGDLCPLAHLALGLLGEGDMWSPLTGWAPAGEVLKQNGLEPIDLGYKEGLALINGTQMVSALGAMGKYNNISLHN
jgi:histidine ammonia-lyase